MSSRGVRRFVAGWLGLLAVGCSPRYTSTVEREVARRSVTRRVAPVEARARVGVRASGDDVTVAAVVDTMCLFARETRVLVAERTVHRRSELLSILEVVITAGGGLTLLAGLQNEFECRGVGQSCSGAEELILTGLVVTGLGVTALAFDAFPPPDEHRRTLHALPTGAGLAVCGSAPWAGARVEWVASTSLASAETTTDARGRARFAGVLAREPEGDLLIEGQVVAHVRRASP
ncbi:MAG: hypothetical protein IT376_16115 [Polyangiaceae bacterium]|nr:hypothetical protein [Polyangiaceae bacterium]